MRKTTATLLTLLLFTQAAFSQTARKTWYVGANASRNFEFYDTKFGGPKGTWSTLIEVPAGGYFVAKRLLLGTGFSVNLIPKHILERNQWGGVGHIYSINPYVRYYLGNEIVKPFLQLQYRYGKQDSQLWGPTTGMIPNDARKTVQVFQGKLGFAFALTKALHLEAGFYVDQSISKNKITKDSLGYPYEITYRYRNLGFSLGLGYHFIKG